LASGNPAMVHSIGGCNFESQAGNQTYTAGVLAAHVAAGLALSQESTTTKGHVDQSTRDRPQSFNDAITILRERITTWVVVDILELF
jgi:hypothetical protein